MAAQGEIKMDKKSKKTLKAFNIFLYILFSVFLAAALFFAIDTLAGASPLSSGWQNTSNLLNFVVGVPVALVASVVALILAINSLSISKSQHESGIAASVLSQLSESVKLFNFVATDLDALFRIDRETRRYFEYAAGTPEKRSIPAKKLESMEIDDNFLEIYNRFSAELKSLKFNLINLLSNPLAVKLMSEMESKRIKEKSLLHTLLAENFKESPESILPFSWHLSENPKFIEFMQNLLMAMRDDVSSDMPEEGFERVKSLLIFVNYVSARMDYNWQRNFDIMAGSRIYYVGGRVFWEDYDEMGVVNFGAVFLHDLSQIFPSSDVCVKVLQEVSKSWHGYEIEEDKIISLMTAVDLSQVASIIVPTRGVIKNWSTAMTKFIVIPDASVKEQGSSQ